MGFARRDFYSETGGISLAGRLHIDLIQQNSTLPNNVDIKIVIIMNESSFVLMDGSVDKFSLNVEEVTLYVKKFCVNPTFRINMEKQLSLKNILYPITGSIVKTYSILANQRMFNHENIFLGPLPVRILVAFVDSKAYYGEYNKNPFNFQNFDINF